MGRKRKLFLGTESIGGKSMKSRRKARFVTSQYHNIRNELEAIEKDFTIQEKEKEKMKELLNEQLIGETLYSVFFLHFYLYIYTTDITDTAVVY